MTYKVLGLRETELCLGLPGGGDDGGGDQVVKNGKRGRFPQSVDLKLKLDSSPKDFFREAPDLDSPTKGIIKPPAKAQVVGWPPVRSYRKNTMATTTLKSDTAADDNKKDNKAAAAAGGGGGGSNSLVKVSIDGAPYLRKVDLKQYKSYQQLSHALANLFTAFTLPTGMYGAKEEGMIDFMNKEERKVKMNMLNSCSSDDEFVPTYEDKDGDWMLVGDVPWDMFVESCKRLRIMKGSDTIGLAPRAMEKCKNSS